MAEHADEPLLPQQQQQKNGLPAPEDDASGDRCGRTTWTIMALAFLLFTLNIGAAVYQSQRVSVFVAYGLLGIILCLRRHDMAEPGSQVRNQLKVAIWLLMTGLAILVACSVATAIYPLSSP